MPDDSLIKKHLLKLLTFLIIFYFLHNFKSVQNKKYEQYYTVLLFLILIIKGYYFFFNDSVHLDSKLERRILFGLFRRIELNFG